MPGISAIGTLARYFSLRFLIAMLAMFLLCCVLIFFVDFIEMLRRAGNYDSGVSGFLLAWMTLLRLPSFSELTLPFAVLIGLAFSSCLIAFTATQKNDVGFSAIFRFVINPLFLFSGTFFPLTQLPEPLQLVAWAPPLYHGVELVRGAILDTLDPVTAPLHLAYLLVMFTIGATLAERNLTRRMAG